MTLGEGHAGFLGPRPSIQLQAIGAACVFVVQLSVQALGRPYRGVLLWGRQGSASPHCPRQSLASVSSSHKTDAMARRCKGERAYGRCPRPPRLCGAPSTYPARWARWWGRLGPVSLEPWTLGESLPVSKSHVLICSSRSCSHSSSDPLLSLSPCGWGVWGTPGSRTQPGQQGLPGSGGRTRWTVASCCIFRSRSGCWSLVSPAPRATCSAAPRR